MILGIGIDVVEVARFKPWESYSQEQLLKLFSPTELAAMPTAHVAEYLASRFAAKEAFYKALSNALIQLECTKISFSFEFARQHVEVIKGVWDVPQLQVNWQEFEEKIDSKLPQISMQLSLAHERSIASAMVLLSD